jgi:hypothetical protein
MSVRLVPARRIIRQPEHVLWRLAKNNRFAEARVRLTPIGAELRFFIFDADAAPEDQQLLWSQLFRPGVAGRPRCTTRRC